MGLKGIVDTCCVIAIQFLVTDRRRDTPKSNEYLYFTVRLAGIFDRNLPFILV